MVPMWSLCRTWNVDGQVDEEAAGALPAGRRKTAARSAARGRTRRIDFIRHLSVASVLMLSASVVAAVVT
jgi:hypothetical protein